VVDDLCTTVHETAFQTVQTKTHTDETRRQLYIQSLLHIGPDVFLVLGISTGLAVLAGSFG